MDHQAFAQLLGNYGEFVGAIAVVATLAYLAVQVRHSRAATETNTKQLVAMMEAEMTTHWLSNAQVVADNAELADIFYRIANEPESVSPQEHARMTFWTIACLKSGEFTYHQLQAGNLDESLWEGNHALLLSGLVPPNHPWRLGWPSTKHMFTQEYKDYIDSLVPGE